MHQQNSCKPAADTSHQVTITELSGARRSLHAINPAGVLCASLDAVAPAAQAEETATFPYTELEQPYHVFPKGLKRFLVGVIGVAGLFSGLSSNIYFPSLDAIAKVSQLCAVFGHR